MTVQGTLDEGKMDAFLQRVVRDLSGTVVTLMCSLGDRLGLFKILATLGPVSSTELARQAGVNERYTREWLHALLSAGYLTYDPMTECFSLPGEHAPALAHEGGPVFVGGLYQQLPALLTPFNRLVRAFREGGGIPAAAFDENCWEGMSRVAATWFDNLLVPEWLPMLPDVRAKLEGGVRVADIGCGYGRALVNLAQAFPCSYFVGYDHFEPALQRARQSARKAGVEDRVRFRALDVSEGLPEAYDLITTFDVVHDLADPPAALRAIREALRPDGVYVMLEINSAERPEDNSGPLGALMYGISVLYCMTTSLAHQGAGLGTLGLPEPAVRALCRDAGFSSVRQAALNNPIHVLYEIKP